MYDFGGFLYMLLELSGIASFAISGAMTAISKRFDAFGVAFIGVVTALGGGVFRDILLGSFPPMMFRNYSYLITAVMASVIVFCLAFFFKDIYLKRAPLIDKINNLFDAVGLGLFTALGVRTAIDAGFSENAFFCIFLGIATGTGGGMLRDMMTNSMPVIFRKHIYAVASAVGAAIYYSFMRFSVDIITATAVSALAVFVIRVLATKYKWNFPRIH